MGSKIPPSVRSGPESLFKFGEKDDRTFIKTQNKMAREVIRSFHWSSREWNQSLYRGDPSTLTIFLPPKDTRRGLSSEPNHRDSNLRLPSSRTVRNRSLWLIGHPIYGALF